MIWLIFVFLTGAAVLAVLAPLAAKSASASDAATDKAFFGEQLAEIERERAEGLLDPADAEGARLEAARRLLRASETDGATAHPSNRKTRVVAALATLLLVPALAIALYLSVGAAGLPDMPLAARLAATPPHADLSAAVAQIEAHLAEHPDDGRGFEVVATFLPARRPLRRRHTRVYRGAAPARGDPDPLRRSGRGLCDGGPGRGDAGRPPRFRRRAGVGRGASDVALLFALAAAQDGDTAKADDLWSKLLADAPADAGYRDLVRAQIEKLRGEASQSAPSGEAGKSSGEGPASEQGRAVAAMPKADQQAFIRSMVERLAGRLAQNGDDVEGWLKLLRAYGALSEPEKAKAALKDASKALADKPADLARVEALAAELNIER